MFKGQEHLLSAPFPHPKLWSYTAETRDFHLTDTLSVLNHSKILLPLSIFSICPHGFIYLMFCCALLRP